MGELKTYNNNSCKRYYIRKITATTYGTVGK
jgi:hypothetical protein